MGAPGRWGLVVTSFTSSVKVLMVTTVSLQNLAGRPRGAMRDTSAKCRTGRGGASVKSWFGAWGVLKQSAKSQAAASSAANHPGMRKRGRAGDSFEDDGRKQ